MAIGCGEDTPSAPDAAPPAVDASAADAADLPCTAAESQTYYADFDGDGYGTPELTAVDCVQPDRFIDNDLDCDDSDSRSNPEGIELCDGIDNDCNAATTEVCENSCSPQIRETNTYLFCAQVRSYSVAKAACVTEGMHLLRIEDAQEQAWASAQRVTAFGGFANVWMGANDATTEGAWGLARQ